MALDPSIILQTRGVQLDNPIDTQNKLAQLQQVRNQNRLADISFADNQRERASENSLSQLLANGKNGDDVVRGLASQGFGARGLAYGKQYLDQRKATADIGKTTADIDKTKADTGKSQQETAMHQFEIAGQLANAWVNNPGVTKIQIQSGLTAAAHSGVISQQVAQAKLNELAAVGDDAKSLNGWASGVMSQVMKAKDAMSYMKPDANAVLSDNRIKSEGAANRQNQITVQKMIGERQDKKDADDGTGLSDASKLRIAKQFVDAGDASGMKNVGRGMQGAKDMRSIQNAITDYAAEKGLTPAEISGKIADFEGLKAGLRTSAGISARVENAIAEADELAPLAVEAGRRVARSGFLPFGRLQVMFNNQTNDPDMNRFATANIGLATAYAGAMARGQKPTVHDKEHAEKVIGEAKSQEAYEAVVDQLQLEMAAAKRAPHKVRESLRGEISGGKNTGHDAPAGAPVTKGNAKPSLSDIFGK